MGEACDIGWCDSTVNPVMGCDGCELWTEKKRTCYAGVLTERHAGEAGWPDAFTDPKLFPGRMAKAARWKDLRGVARSDKPWIPPAMPRLVFISDMGDALSRPVPFEFLWSEVVLTVAAWPHVGLWLTKQPRRMAEFSRWLVDNGQEWPVNLWAGTSVTTQSRWHRAVELMEVGDDRTVRFLSLEPLLERVHILGQTAPNLGEVQAFGHVWSESNVRYEQMFKPRIHWAIGGLESGAGRADTGTAGLSALHGLALECKAVGVPFFCKQDSAFRPGQRGRLDDKLWGTKQFPNVPASAANAETASKTVPQRELFSPPSITH